MDIKPDGRVGNSRKPKSNYTGQALHKRTNLPKSKLKDASICGVSTAEAFSKYDFDKGFVPIPEEVIKKVLALTKSQIDSGIPNPVLIELSKTYFERCSCLIGSMMLGAYDAVEIAAMTKLPIIFIGSLIEKYGIEWQIGLKLKNLVGRDRGDYTLFFYGNTLACPKLFAYIYSMDVKTMRSKVKQILAGKDNIITEDRGKTMGAYKLYHLDTQYADPRRSYDKKAEATAPVFYEEE